MRVIYLRSCLVKKHMAMHDEKYVLQVRLVTPGTTTVHGHHSYIITQQNEKKKEYKTHCNDNETLNTIIAYYIIIYKDKECTLSLLFSWRYWLL